MLSSSAFQNFPFWKEKSLFSVTFTGTDCLSTACRARCAATWALSRSYANPLGDSNFPSISLSCRSSSLPCLFAMFIMTIESLLSENSPVLKSCCASRWTDLNSPDKMCSPSPPGSANTIKAWQINTWKTEEMLIWATAGCSLFPRWFRVNDPVYLLKDCWAECEFHSQSDFCPVKKLRLWTTDSQLSDWDLKTSLCQTLQTYMRTVVMHVAGNGLKCINMCILKRALHYPAEWVHAWWGDVITHATCSLGLRSVAGADERWLQLIWILCMINICSLASLRKKRRKIKNLQHS